jgi:putative chitobiose transport system permease protein
MRRSLTPYLFLAPALVMMAVFTLLPLLAVAGLSFTEYDVLRPPVFVGVNNYVDLLTEPDFWQALGHSVIYLIVTPTLIVLSILLAIAVNRSLPAIGAFRALYYIPVVTGSVTVGIAWRWLFDTRGGLVNGALTWLGLNDFISGLGFGNAPLNWLTAPEFTLPLAMSMTIWMGVGYYMVVFLAGLQSISDDLYDAAVIDGCNGWQKHWHVSLPGLRPSIVFVAVISSLSALKVFDEIYVLTNASGGRLNSGVTIVFYLWEQAFRLQNVGYASAVALVLLVITLAFSIFNVRWLERGQEAGR